MIQAFRGGFLGNDRVRRERRNCVGENQARYSDTARLLPVCEGARFYQA
jgi:hypothetical protein